jgi:hypothetical protein
MKKLKRIKPLYFKLPIKFKVELFEDNSIWIYGIGELHYPEDAVFIEEMCLNIRETQKFLTKCNGQGKPSKGIYSYLRHHATLFKRFSKNRVGV